jgi:16S rRNA pseudouridine516 synthase
VDIDGYVTAPCSVELTGERKGIITLTEGKYHQIKLMLAAVHNQVTFLKRISFAEIALDSALEEGSWRYLSEKEIEILESRF